MLNLCALCVRGIASDAFGIIGGRPSAYNVLESEKAGIRRPSAWTREELTDGALYAHPVPAPAVGSADVG
jgi:hypothetical protein